MRNVAIEMAMDLCIDEKDEERESEAQSAANPIDPSEDLSVAGLCLRTWLVWHGIFWHLSSLQTS